MDAGAKGLTIRDLPLMYHERTGEAKLDSFRDGWRHVKFMLVNTPGYLFSGPGMAMGTFGVLIMALGYFNMAVMGQPIGVNSIIAGSLLTLVGYQAGCFGFLTDLASDPSRRPDEPITCWMHEHFSLERGIALGVGLFTTGTLGVTWLVYEWISSGFQNLPSIPADIVVFTAIVLGLQTVFGLFFASIVQQE